MAARAGEVVRGAGEAVRGADEAEPGAQRALQAPRRRQHRSSLVATLAYLVTKGILRRHRHHRALALLHLLHRQVQALRHLACRVGWRWAGAGASTSHRLCCACWCAHHQKQQPSSQQPAATRRAAQQRVEAVAVPPTLVSGELKRILRAALIKDRPVGQHPRRVRHLALRACRGGRGGAARRGEAGGGLERGGRGVAPPLPVLRSRPTGPATAVQPAGHRRYSVVPWMRTCVGALPLFSLHHSLLDHCAVGCR